MLIQDANSSIFGQRNKNHRPHNVALSAIGTLHEGPISHHESPLTVDHNVVHVEEDAKGSKIATLTAIVILILVCHHLQKRRKLATSTNATLPHDPPRPTTTTVLPLERRVYIEPSPKDLFNDSEQLRLLGYTKFELAMTPNNSIVTAFINLVGENTVDCVLSIDFKESLQKDLTWFLTPQPGVGGDATSVLIGRLQETIILAMESNILWRQCVIDVSFKIAERPSPDDHKLTLSFTVQPSLRPRDRGKDTLTFNRGRIDVYCHGRNVEAYVELSGMLELGGLLNRFQSYLWRVAPHLLPMTTGFFNPGSLLNHTNEAIENEDEIIPPVVEESTAVLIPANIQADDSTSLYSSIMNTVCFIMGVVGYAWSTGHYSRY